MDGIPLLTSYGFFSNFCFSLNKYMYRGRILSLYYVGKVSILPGPKPSTHSTKTNQVITKDLRWKNVPAVVDVMERCAQPSEQNVAKLGLCRSYNSP